MAELKRAALCLSGQMRNLQKTFEHFIEPNLFKSNPQWQIDVFAHSWFQREDVGSVYKTAGGGNGSNPIPIDVLIQLYEKYNPKKVLIEEQIIFDEKNFASRKAQLIVVKYSLSKMYSIYQSSKLRQKYETENNMKYDMVILGRYDIGIQQPIFLDEYNPGSYNVSQHGATNDGVDVTHGIMGPTVFDRFAELYFKVEEYWNNGALFVDEQLAGIHLRKEEILIERHAKMNNYILVRE